MEGKGDMEARTFESYEKEQIKTLTTPFTTAPTAFTGQFKYYLELLRAPFPSTKTDERLPSPSSNGSNSSMAAMAAMAAMSYCFLDGGIEGRRGGRAHVLLALGLSFLATDHAAPHSKKSTAWEGGEFWASCFSGPGTVS